MKIQRIDNTNFKSTFAPTPTLRYAFERSAKRSDAGFLRAVTNIINDGKKDVITVNAFKDDVTGFFQGTHLFVNDKLVAKDVTPYETRNAGIYSIMDSARNVIKKSFGYNKSSYDEYADLSSMEIKRSIEKIKNQIFVE